MPVKRIVTPTGPSRKVSASLKGSPLQKTISSNGPKKLGSELAELSLPSGPKEPDTDLNHYTILLYGREKIGKTQIFSTFPEALFFATEPGTKGLAIAEFNSEDGGVKSWDIFRRGVELLEQSKAYKKI